MVATRLVERYARRRTLFDVPNNRSSHVVPTPRLGGIGIVLGTTFGWFAAGGAGDAPIAGVMLAGIGLAIVGLVDDLVHVRVATKYAAQLAAAAVGALLVAPTLDFEILGVHTVVSGPAAVVLATLWLTATINAFNFIDGIDGIAGGMAAATALIATVLVAPAGDRILLAIVGACLGFLVWNHHPASIFMGDVGSQFLGYLLGLALLLGPGGTVQVVPVLLITSPLILDTGVTLVRRLASRKNVFAAHREHLYQRLAERGFGVRSVSALYVGATVLGGLLAVTWSTSPDLRAPVVAATFLLAVGYVLWAERVTA